MNCEEPINYYTFTFIIQEYIYIPMDKPNKPKAKIIEKVPLKSKLSMKSAITQKSQLMVGRFAFEDSLVACGYSDGFVRIFNINTDNKISQINTNTGENNSKPVNSIRWRPANQQLGSISSVILVANTDGHIYQYVAKTGKKIYEHFEQGNFTMCLDYAPDGKRFCTGGKDNIIRVYDEETKEVSNQLSGIKWHTHGHNNRIFSLKFAPDDPNIIASGGWDQNINIWDLREGNSVATMYGPKITGDSVDIRGEYVLAGSNRGNDQLELWDWRMNKLAMKFQWDEEKEVTNAFLFSAQFCHNSKETVIGAGGQQMKMFSLNDGSEMLEIRVQEQVTLYSCDSAHSANKYLVGGNSGTMYYMVGMKSYE